MLHKYVFGIKSILISKYTLLCVTEFSDHSKGVCCQLTYSSQGFGSAFVRLLLLLSAAPTTPGTYDGNREYSPLQTEKYI